MASIVTTYKNTEIAYSKSRNTWICGEYDVEANSLEDAERSVDAALKRDIATQKFDVWKVGKYGQEKGEKLTILAAKPSRYGSKRELAFHSKRADGKKYRAWEAETNFYADTDHNARLIAEFNEAVDQVSALKKRQMDLTAQLEPVSADRVDALMSSQS